MQFLLKDSVNTATFESNALLAFGCSIGIALGTGTAEIGNKVSVSNLVSQLSQSISSFQQLIAGWRVVNERICKMEEIR